MSIKSYQIYPMQCAHRKSAALDVGIRRVFPVIMFSVLLFAFYWLNTKLKVAQKHLNVFQLYRMCATFEMKRFTCKIVGFYNGVLDRF